MKEIITLKIRNDSNPNSVAGSIAASLKENKKVELKAIGAGAVNQAVKSIAVARSFVAPVGIDLSCIPAFVDADTNLDGETRTCIKFILKEEN